MCSIGSQSTAGVGALSKGAIGGGVSIGGAAGSGTLMGGGSVARLMGGTSTLLGREPTTNSNTPGVGGDPTGRGRGPVPGVRSY